MSTTLHDKLNLSATRETQGHAAINQNVSPATPAARQSVERFQQLLDNPSSRLPTAAALRQQRQAHTMEDAIAADGSRVNQQHEFSTITASVAPPSDANAAQDLLQQLCSGLYVATGRRSDDARLLVALQGMQAAAAVEFIREGALLRVRVLARDDSALRLLSLSKRELQEALGRSTALQVQVEVALEHDPGNDSGNDSGIDPDAHMADHSSHDHEDDFI